VLSGRLLTQFVAVAEELNFGRAAVRVHMAQSPLSQAIRRLEQNLGAQLFVRTKRSVSLTAAGEVLLRQAKAMLRAEHATISMVRRAEEAGAGRLAVGFVGTVAYGVVPRLLWSFRRAHPGVQLDISEMTTMNQLLSLKAGQLDLGMVRLPLPDEPGIITRTIETDRFGLAVPTSSPWAARRTIALADLRNESFVAYSHDRVPILHSHGVSMCLEEGFYPNIVCEAWQASSILSFVAAGVGLALIPWHISELRHAGVTYRPLSRRSPNTRLEIVAMWREDNRSPALDLFIDRLDADPNPAFRPIPFKVFSPRPV